MKPIVFTPVFVMCSITASAIRSSFCVVLNTHFFFSSIGCTSADDPTVVTSGVFDSATQSSMASAAGVVVGLLAVMASGWQWLDPVIAIAVALNILREGGRLVWRSSQGLMDRALPDEDHARVVDVLESYRAERIDYHALRTRESGARRFVEVHLLVPGAWTVRRGHDLAERVEAEIRAALEHTTVITHVEPLEDPVSQEDIELDR